MTAQLGQIGYFEAAADVPQARFQTHIDGFLRRHGLQHYSFVQLRSGASGHKARDLNLHSNYNASWLRRYKDRRYDQVDPVCDLGRRARSPFWWGGSRFLSCFEKRQKRVFWEAKDFGITFGVSVPVRAIDGSLGLVSYTGDSAKGMRDVMHESGPELHMAAHQITDRLIETDARQEPENSPLSTRERETLIWVVQGMTSEEIADRMLLSVSAINYHLGKATRKLSARNRHHAALLAMTKGFI